MQCQLWVTPMVGGWLSAQVGSDLSELSDDVKITQLSDVLMHDEIRQVATSTLAQPVLCI